MSFGLYIHWPFCVSKCPYCDFNSHVRNKVNYDQWESALLKELEYIGSKTNNRVINSVFFGGGTPSLMLPNTINALLSCLNKYWKIDPNIEITLEGNPNSIEAQKYKDFKSAGINRVSIGIQSLRQHSLQFLGRTHGVDEAKNALKIASSIFDKVSFDLIYALPNQTIKEWEQELKEAIELAKGHLSLYQLTIEEGTQFYHKFNRGELILPSPDLSAQLFEKTSTILAQYKYYPYEVSNYAMIGHECMHNKIYWNYMDYACIGPGAHGRITLKNKKIAIKNYKTPEKWLTEVQKNGHGQELIEEILETQQITEHLLMGFRLYEGINKKQFLIQHNFDLNIISKTQTIINLKHLGLLQENDTHLSVTPHGMLKLNKIIEQIVCLSEFDITKE